MSKLAYHGLKEGAGEKDRKPKPKRKCFSSSMSDLPVRVKLGERSWPKSPTYTCITPPSTCTPGGQQSVSQSVASPSILRSPSAQPYI